MQSMSVSLLTLIVLLLLIVAATIRIVSAWIRRPPVRLAILTRTGTRRVLFGRLYESIRSQKLGPGQSVRLLLSNDNPTCDFLPDDATVVEVAREAKSGKDACPYNAYLNPLLREVRTDEWVMILDDDAKLTDANHIRRLLAKLSRLDGRSHMALQPIRIGRRGDRWPERRKGSPAGWRIDMANLVFHGMHAWKLHTTKECGGDKLLFRQLVDDVGLSVVSPSGGEGVWANYEGWRGGAD